jgi:PAS domain-containing protein
MYGTNSYLFAKHYFAIHEIEMTEKDVHIKLIDTFPLSAFFIDNEGRILHVNPRCLKMVNVSLDEVTNQSIRHFFSEFDACLKYKDRNIETTFIDKDLNIRDV